jgi:hypothetical protein
MHVTAGRVLPLRVIAADMEFVRVLSSDPGVQIFLHLKSGLTVPCTNFRTLKILARLELGFCTASYKAAHSRCC